MITTIPVNAIVIQRVDRYIAVVASRARLNNLTEATPASATDSGTKGQITYDATYIYVCIATDTWVRAELNSW